MKKSIVFFSGLVLFLITANIAIGQQINTGGTGNTAGGRCKILSGPNGGKSGTYDGTGWCCTGANGGGDVQNVLEAMGRLMGNVLMHSLSPLNLILP
jgi:hypothetical protein